MYVRIVPGLLRPKRLSHYLSLTYTFFSFSPITSRTELLQLARQRAPGPGVQGRRVGRCVAARLCREARGDDGRRQDRSEGGGCGSGRDGAVRGPELPGRDQAEGYILQAPARRRRLFAAAPEGNPGVFRMYVSALDCSIRALSTAVIVLHKVHILISSLSPLPLSRLQMTTATGRCSTRSFTRL
jgi:hypothetical protein